MAKKKGKKVGQKQNSSVLKKYGKPPTFEEKQQMHIIGAIFNGDGSFGTHSSNILSFFLPKLFEEAAFNTGKKIRFPPNPLRYEAYWDGKNWKGGFILPNASDDVKKGFKDVVYDDIKDAWESAYKEEERKSSETIKDITEAIKELSAPNPSFNMYLLPVSVPGHYNSCVIVKGPKGFPVGYWFEPHNVYDLQKYKASGYDESFLPYGIIEKNFQQLTGLEDLKYNECPYSIQGSNDTLCQAWSYWFLYLMAGGMDYDAAKEFIGKNNSAGLYKWFMHIATICFTAHNISRRGVPGLQIFEGSLMYAAPGKTNRAPYPKSPTKIIEGDNIPPTLEDVLAKNHHDKKKAVIKYYIEKNFMTATANPTYAPWAKDKDATAETKGAMFTDRTHPKFM